MIYTKQGDGGTSKTIKGFSQPKDAPVFQALGTLDELSAALGVAKSEAGATVRDTITVIQSELLGVGEYVAGGRPFDFAAAANRFETLIDAFENRMQREKAFVLSGKTKLGALLDVARTVARRAERSVVTLTKRYMLPPDINPYLNRLSDLLYILARYVDQLGNVPESVQRAAEPAAVPTEMGLQCAERICRAVLEKARAMDLRAVCTVCSAEGSLFALLRDDGALLASIDIAQQKAKTAISLQMSTKQALELSEQKDRLYGLQFGSAADLILLPGGQTLTQNGRIVGGVGVSGGLAWQDDELSLYGKELFERGEA
ncbi:MAG: cob(I)yrinic acid a,c-diamide adenosyltransferase [Clostridia bacterium]|nr:cob(I)yrinic acid a,c-diamide adenosyltransferase [Clostridia bacterium]